MDVSIPFKRYILGIFAGFIVLLLGAVNVSSSFNEWSNDWSKNWFKLLVFGVLIMIGYAIANKGMNEWAKNEKVEYERLGLENKKLELEIKLLEKELKSKK